MNILTNPNKIYPVDVDKSIVLLKNVVKNPNIEIGDYTFYHDINNPLDFERNNVLYQYYYNHDKLKIGKFCSIAMGAKFIFNGANHSLKSFSTYPFPLFADEKQYHPEIVEAWDNKGDIVIGNDIWLGYDSIIMAGVTIGDGAIIGTRALVTKDVAPYTIVGGIPAKPIRKRFDDETIEFLQKIQWWNWDVSKIAEHLPLIQSGNIEKLK
jgi:virginiamycin A acetyltransferase